MPKSKTVNLDVSLLSVKDHEDFLRSSHFDDSSTGSDSSVMVTDQTMPPDGLLWGTPGFTNTCNIDMFLTALRLCFFYIEFNFEAKLKHTRPRPKRLEDAVRVIAHLSKEEKVDSNLIKIVYSNIVGKKPDPQTGIRDFIGREEFIFPHFRDVMEYIIKFRCACSPDLVNFNADTFARTVSVLKLREKQDIINFGIGKIRDPSNVWTHCNTCKTNYNSILFVPDTTWMLAVNLMESYVHFANDVPRKLDLISQTEGGSKLTTWRLAYISGS
jgi:hypothetical protein